MTSKPVLDRLFTGLRSRQDDVRQRHLVDLGRFLEEGVDVATAKVLNEKLRELFALPDTKLAGLQCVRTLLPFEYMDTNTRFIMFTNHVRSCFPTEVLEVSVYAAEVWGKVIKSCGTTLAVEVVEAELKRALEWLCVDSTTARKFAAVLMLKEIANNVPTHFTSSVEVCADQLWNAVRDTQAYIREAAVSALSAILRHVARIQPSSRLTYIIIDKCHRMIHMKANESAVHGGMLALTGLLSVLQPEPPRTLEALLTQGCPEKVKDVLTTVLSGGGKMILSNAACRTVALQMVPLLAGCTVSQFAANFLQETMKLMSSVLRNMASSTMDRSAAFLCIGGLVRSLHLEIMAPYLNEISNHIGAFLIVSRKPKRDRCPAAVQCLVMCVEEGAATMQPFIISQMDALFSVPVGTELAVHLKQIAACFPSLRAEIQERLLRNLRQTLQTLNTEHGDRGLLLQCFDVLSQCDFQSHSLTDLCERNLEPQFVNPDRDVRLASLRTCVTIVLCGCFGQNIECSVDDSGMILHTGQNHKAAISRIVHRLIAVSVTDQDPAIRSMLLTAFSVKFDQQLAMGQCITQLFIAVEDEVYANREAAMTIIGRLTRRNPACSLPYLRQTLLHVTTELQFSLNTKKQVLASQMIAHIIVCAPVLVKPYIRALLNITIEKLRNTMTNTTVISSLLATLGKLAYDVEARDFSHLQELMPFVLNHVQDKSSSLKRQHALVAFGCIVHATGDVMEPYLRYPHLLPSLTTLMHGAEKETWTIRNEVLKVIGIIGALDPYEVKRSITTPANGAANVNRVPIILTPTGRGAEDNYPRIAIQSILGILAQTNLGDQCYHYAVEALVKIFTTRTMRMSLAVQHLPIVVPAITRMLCTCERMRDKIFKELFLLVNVMRQHIRIHAQLLLEAIRLYWKTEEQLTLMQILSLVAEMRMALNEEFKPELNWLIPQLLHIVAHDTERRELTSKVLSVMESFGALLDTHVHVVVPMLLECAAGTDITMEVRSRALGTLTSLITILPLVQFSSRIVHVLVPLITEDGPPMERSGMVSLPSASSLDGWTEALQSASLRTQQGGNLTPFNTDALYALCVLATSLGQQYKDFVPMVSHELNSRLIATHPLLVYYNNLQKTTVTQAVMVRAQSVAVQQNRQASTESVAPGTALVRTADQMTTLLRLLQTANRNTAEHWPYWLNQVSMELIKESPSPAFRACVALAQAHLPLAQELFNATFMSCFHLQMDSSTRENVLGFLKDALRSTTIPVEVLQVLLNLSEYMSHYDHQIPTSFDPRMLSALAEQCQLYAKAMRYTETTFTLIVAPFEAARARGEDKRMSVPEWLDFIACCEKMIALATKLGLSESAQGVLAYVQRNFAAMTGQSDWGGEFTLTDAEMCEKLQWWTEAWRAYDVRYRRTNDLQCAVGVLRSMEAMGEWARLLEFWKELVPIASPTMKEEMAPMASHAAWLLTKWDDMHTATKMMSQEGYAGATLQFYRSVLAVNANQLDTAEVHIGECRKSLDRVLTALIGESYGRAYDKLVGLQQMSELEEIVTCLRRGNTEEDRRALAQVWWRRLSRMQPEMEIWQGTLTNHMLLLSPDQDVQSWLQFVKICSDCKKHKIARRAVMRLLGQSTECETDSLDFLKKGSGTAVHHEVVIAYLDHLWNVESKLTAVSLLHEFRAHLAIAPTATNRERAECQMRSGLWQRDLGGPAAAKSVEIMASLAEATVLDPRSYTAWHTFASFNSEALRTSGVDGLAGFDLSPENENYVTSAFKAYVEAVCCSPSDESLQDVLRLLSLWFAHGTNPRLSVLIKEAIDRIPITTWLRVIPQIIARVHLRQPEIHETIFALLTRIGQTHPHAIVFPLQVFINGDMHPNSSARGSVVADVQSRLQAATALLQVIAAHSDNGRRIVAQVHNVSRSLIRIASLWSEMLFDATEEVHRVGFPDKSKAQSRENIDPSAFEEVEPLLQFFSKAETPAEIQFLQIYGEELKDVQQLISTGENRAAWDALLSVYRKIQRQRPYLTSLDLQFACPSLLESKTHCDVVMPGHYTWSKGDLVVIQCFDPILKVITSKQRPRKLVMKGSNGVDYKYLLKGHEDLRLDERVMQLFGLVNVALSRDLMTAKRDLFIEQYPVIPLSDNAGLIGWVDNAETLHVLIRDYRKQSGIDLGVEHQHMTNTVTTEYDKLSLMQKVEVFETALEKTEGTDLKRIMWSGSQNSEVWLERRTLFTRSLATMSMVGYILGLGDRHPSNVMLDSSTGKVVHIDFGDCFEVANLREIFPEKIPFRLTRVLVSAMEVCGIDGLYRNTCDLVMSLLRKERESVKALLEAFAHDPLVNWRLLEPKKVGDVTAPPPALDRKMKRIDKMDTFSGDGVGWENSAKFSRSCFEKSVKGTVVEKGVDDSSKRKAQEVITRISAKLEGREFMTEAVVGGAATTPVVSPEEAPLELDLGRNRQDSFIDSQARILQQLQKSGVRGAAVIVDQSRFLTVHEQVDVLIRQATSHENLCQCYLGWCPFW